MDKRLQIAGLALQATTVLMLLFAFSVLQVPQAAPSPAQPKVQPTASSASNFNDINVTGEIDAATANITTANITTGAITTLSVGGYTQNGAVRGGTSATYTSGTAITHGFGTTPTLCIVQPARDVTSTVTITTTSFSSNMATVATPIYWMCFK